VQRCQHPCSPKPPTRVLHACTTARFSTPHHSYNSPESHRSGRLCPPSLLSPFCGENSCAFTCLHTVDKGATATLPFSSSGQRGIRRNSGSLCSGPVCWKLMYKVGNIWLFPVRGAATTDPDRQPIRAAWAWIASVVPPHAALWLLQFSYGIVLLGGRGLDSDGQQ
jgi:hypothetical protein